MRAGLAGLEGFIIREPADEGVVRRVEACQSPVWDTALVLNALLDAGIAPDDPGMLSAGQWLLGEEIRVAGDWAVRRPGLAPGGWAFEFANDGYPDTDDTAEIVLALRRLQPAEGVPMRAAIDRGVAWLRGMQSRDGGWGAFDADNTHTLADQAAVLRLRRRHRPAVRRRDRAHRRGTGSRRAVDRCGCRRGVRWLLDHQEARRKLVRPVGRQLCVWHRGRGPGPRTAGVPATDPGIAVAVRWLEDHQNGDGGWGEDMRSYSRPGSRRQR